MKVPRQVVIRGEAWDVDVLDDIEDHVPELADSMELAGYCDHSKRRILISADLDPAERASTLLHELLHAALPNWSEARVSECEDALWPVLEQNRLWRGR